MSGKNFFSSVASPEFLKKFRPENSDKEKRKARLVLLFVFGTAVLLVGVAFLFREIPTFWQRFNEPSTVVSRELVPILPTTTPTPKFEKEKEEIEKMIEPLRGRYGVYFQDLESKSSFEINGKEKFAAASLIKLPVILTLYWEGSEGRIDLDTIYKLKESDKRSGAGSLVGKPVGFEITYRKMAELMGKQSDNTAFFVLSKILGAEKIQAEIEALGMKDTSFANQETSPEDIGLFFRKLYGENVVSDKDKEEILSFMTDTIWEDRIPAGVPEGIKVAHKIGTLPGVISDGGIVFGPKPFVLVILTQDINEIEAKKELPEISKKIWEMVNGKEEP